jgi:hypothetical protein
MAAWVEETPKKRRILTIVAWALLLGLLGLFIEMVVIANS